eukprot:5614076-Pleurochrysis_carterae.AAC.3
MKLSQVFAIGSCAAIWWRKQAAMEWKNCVIERTAVDAFSVWSEDGLVKCESYSHCRGEDGAPLDDSVEEEWGMTLAGPPAAKPADNAHPDASKNTPLPVSAAVQLHDAGDHVASLVSGCVRRAIALVQSKYPEAASDPTSPTANNGSSDGDGNGGRTSTVPGSDAVCCVATPVAALEPKQNMRCMVGGNPAFIWSVHGGMTAVCFDDPKAPWETFFAMQFPETRSTNCAA